MSRSYTPRDLVQLPALDAEGAFALASQLTSHAAEVRVPASVGDLVEALDAARQTLGEQLAARRAAPGTDPRAAVDADRAVDAAWAMLRDWLGSWSKLGPSAPRASEIAELHTFLFGEGLTFLSLKYHNEWTASETRMSALRARRNVELVHELGGAPMLEALTVAHDAYGRALGITAAVPARSETKVRDALDAVLDAMREYVVGVASTVRRDRAGSAERAERLLRPLADWQTAGRPGPIPPPAPPEPSEPTPIA